MINRFIIKKNKIQQTARHVFGADPGNPDERQDAESKMRKCSLENKDNKEANNEEHRSRDGRPIYSISRMTQMAKVRSREKKFVIISELRSEV